MKEREIDLIDMLHCIVRHWRLIVVCALVGGVIAGVYSYEKSDREAKAAEVRYNASVEEYYSTTSEDNAEAYVMHTVEEELGTARAGYVRNVAYSEKRRRVIEAYIDNSAYMQLDASQVPQLEIVYAVNSEDMDVSDRIAAVYKTLLSGNGPIEYIAEKNGISTGEVSELINVPESTDQGAYAEETYSFTVKILPETNSFAVKIMAESEATCRDMAQLVKQFLDEQVPDVTKTMGSHKLEVIDEFYAVAPDTALRNLQDTYYSTMSTLENTVATAKASFSSAEQAYYDYLLEPEGVTFGEHQAFIAPKVGVSAKLVLVGVVVMMFGAVVLLALKYIMDNHLKNGDDIQSLLGIPLLGTIGDQSTKKRKLFGWVDQALERLWQWNKRAFTTDESVAFAASAITIAAKGLQSDTICLAGCHLSGGDDQIEKLLVESLCKNGLRVQLADNIIYDAGAMERMNEIGTVVLVEKTGITLYDELVREMELVNRQKLNLLGAVIVNGEAR